MTVAGAAGPSPPAGDRARDSAADERQPEDALAPDDAVAAVGAYDVATGSAVDVSTLSLAASMTSLPEPPEAVAAVAAVDQVVAPRRRYPT